MNSKKYTIVVFAILLSLQSCYSKDYDEDSDCSQLPLDESLIFENLPVVPQKAFYKDVFLDAGIGLTSRKFLYAARYLNLATEGVSFSRSNAAGEEMALQNSIIAGNENDTNGRLLYPDGQPRYRLLFVNGGNATTHGKSLSETARNNMREFVRNGGSYVGTCAGAFFASDGSEGSTNSYYLSLWPMIVNRTHISNSSTGMFIEKKSPLLYYYDFGGDNYISNVRHNGGCYTGELVPNTEVLARYDCPNETNVHMQPSIWAYKENLLTGRVIMEGSHPEEVSSGERRDLTAAMLKYAMDGVGRTTIKGILHNREIRRMDKVAEDNNPQFSRIGDLQCHHFAVLIPEGARNISVSLDSSVDCDLQLAMCKNTFAYPEDADYKTTMTGASQRLTFITLTSGVWYITVKCNTTIDVAETDYGQSYTDKVGVLKGIPYTIMAAWDNQYSGYSGTAIRLSIHGE